MHYAHSAFPYKDKEVVQNLLCSWCLPLQGWRSGSKKILQPLNLSFDLDDRIESLLK